MCRLEKCKTLKTKAEIVSDISNTLLRVLGKKPEYSHVVIQEIAEEDWGLQAC